MKKTEKNIIPLARVGDKPNVLIYLNYVYFVLFFLKKILLRSIRMTLSKQKVENNGVYT